MTSTTSALEANGGVKSSRHHGGIAASAAALVGMCLVVSSFA
jgi:hypothetical protein